MKNQIWSPFNYVVSSENNLAFANSSTVSIFIISSNQSLQEALVYVTRNIHNIPFIKTRHTFFKNSFFPSTIIEWNNLDHNIRNSSSFNVFRNSILKFIRPSPNSLFNSHNPKGIKFITRQRLGLSHLREHKFRQFSRFFKPVLQLWFGY